MAKELTVRTIKALPPGRREIADSAVTGLYLYLDNDGPRSWALRYRRPGTGKSTRLSLGTVYLGDDAPEPTLGGALGLAGARAIAREQRDLIARGIDPQAAKSEARRDTFGAVLDAYYETVVPLKRRNKSAAMKRGWIEKDCADWMSRPIRDIAPRDVRALLNRIVARGSPMQADNVRGVLSPVFQWAWKQEIIAENPIARVDRPVERKSRDRYHDDREIVELWKSALTLGDPWSAFARVLMLTGQRLATVENMRWQDLDLDAGTWTVPGEFMKGGDDHTVPLAPAVVAIIRDIELDGDFVFTATGERLNGRSRFRQRWRQAADDQRLAPMPDWTLHDLRRTMASGMSRLGIALHVIELCLDHKPRALSGVAGIYNRHRFEEEQRDAMLRWAAYVMRLAEEKGDAGSVIHFPVGGIAHT
jgi:integrase